MNIHIYLCMPFRYQFYHHWHNNWFGLFITFLPYSVLKMKLINVNKESWFNIRTFQAKTKSFRVLFSSSADSLFVVTLSTSIIVIVIAICERFQYAQFIRFLLVILHSILFQFSSLFIQLFFPFFLDRFEIFRLSNSWIRFYWCVMSISYFWWCAQRKRLLTLSNLGFEKLIKIFGCDINAFNGNN